MSTSKYGDFEFVLKGFCRTCTIGGWWHRRWSVGNIMSRVYSVPLRKVLLIDRFLLNGHLYGEFFLVVG